MNIFIFIGIFLLFLCQFCEMCKISDSFCYCDDVCSYFGDCCFGHQDYGKPGSFRNISTCRVLSTTSQSKFWVIDKCKNESHHLTDYCLKNLTDIKPHLKLSIPVIGQNDLIYENAYCAQCNGESKFRYMNVSFTCFIKTKFNWEEANKIIQGESSDCCCLSPKINPEKERYCEEPILKKCPKTFPENDIDVINNCSSGKEEIVTDGLKLYRNSYCCKCWNSSCSASFGQGPFFGFSYFLNFNEWEDDASKEMTSNPMVLEDKYNNSINITKFRIIDNLVFYSSFSFICLSLIALSFLILLYIIEDSFHNFGGYLTICLCSCQWVMNFLTLLVLNSEIVQSSSCKYISILQHFVAVATFVWMAVYSLDLLKTFGSKSLSMNRRKGLKKFCVYCAICFSFSAGLVTASSIVEFVAPINSTIRPRYGGDHCWFTSKMGGIIWYFIPVCLLLIWNLGTCITVFYRILSTARDCRVVQQKDSNSTFWLCIRLTAVFGIVYVFQILIILTQIEFLIIIGSIINCLQGLLLTICFAMTKRVYTVVSRTLTTLSTRESKTSNVTSTTKLQPISSSTPCE